MNIGRQWSDRLKIWQEAFEKHYFTMYTLASVRNTIDTRDEFYDAEMNFYNREMPLLQPVRP